MPNRIIKESICTSEDINTLSFEAEVLFYRLMVKADDFGCYHGNVKIIKNTCYPLKADDIKDKQVVLWLNELVARDLIILYTSDGKEYVKLKKWEKHQQKRANKPKFPLPQASDINCNQVKSNVPVFENVNENENVIENDILSSVFVEIIDYLNKKAGTSYKSSIKKTRSHIRARVEEGFTVENFKMVIDKKVADWLNTDMSKYLRPETLFSTKFEGYLNQKTNTKDGGKNGSNSKHAGEQEFKLSGFKTEK